MNILRKTINLSNLGIYPVFSSKETCAGGCIFDNLVGWAKKEERALSLLEKTGGDFSPVDVYLSTFEFTSSDNRYLKRGTSPSLEQCWVCEEWEEKED